MSMRVGAMLRRQAHLFSGVPFSPLRFNLRSASAASASHAADMNPMMYVKVTLLLRLCRRLLLFLALQIYRRLQLPLCLHHSYYASSSTWGRMRRSAPTRTSPPPSICYCPCGACAGRTSTRLPGIGIYGEERDQSPTPRS